MSDPTFAGAPKTTNGSFDPATDHKTPQLGALDLGNMPSLTAMAGTTGTDTKLIHGDRWQQIDGKQTEKVNKDLKTDIMGIQTWEIHKDLKFTVDGTTTDNRIQEHNQYFHAASLFEYVNTHTDNHHEHEEEHNPTHTFHILNWEGSWKLAEISGIISTFEAKGTSIGAFVAKAEGLAGGAEAFGVKVGAGAFLHTSKLIDHEEKALESRLKAIENDIGGIKNQTMAFKVMIMPTRVGLCVAIHIDSPVA